MLLKVIVNTQPLIKYSLFQGNVSTLSSICRISQCSIYKNFAIAGITTKITSGVGFLFEEGTSTNVSVNLSDISDNSWSSCVLSLVSGHDRKRTIAAFNYGDGDYNRPHSVQTKFYIKY
jgi:hypothetical protein